MVEAEEVKAQLRAEYRREADFSDRRAKIARALAVTERQVAVIGQKLASVQEMKSHLEERVAKYHGWLAQLDEQP